VHELSPEPPCLPEGDGALPPSGPPLFDSFRFCSDEACPRRPSRRCVCRFPSAWGGRGTKHDSVGRSKGCKLSSLLIDTFLPSCLRQAVPGCRALSRLCAWLPTPGCRGTHVGMRDRQRMTVRRSSGRGKPLADPSALNPSIGSTLPLDAAVILAHVGCSASGLVRCRNGAKLLRIAMGRHRGRPVVTDPGVTPVAACRLKEGLVGGRYAVLTQHHLDQGASSDRSRDTDTATTTHRRYGSSEVQARRLCLSSRRRFPAK